MLSMSSVVQTPCRSGWPQGVLGATHFEGAGDAVVEDAAVREDAEGLADCADNPAASTTIANVPAPIRM